MKRIVFLLVGIMVLFSATITTATTTAISATDAASAGSTNYRFETDFLLSTGGTQVQLTLDAKTSAGTLTIEPGSFCAWDNL